ncbi:MAG: hypothetical protein R2744_12150 [Bacteroidales bacterium]
MKDPFVAAGVPLSELKHWEMAPSNAAMVNRAGIEFSLTADGLSKPDDFLVNMRRRLRRDWTVKALKAATHTGQDGRCRKHGGVDQEGMVANLAGHIRRPVR